MGACVSPTLPTSDDCLSARLQVQAMAVSDIQQTKLDIKVVTGPIDY